MQKKLRISKKSSNFAGVFDNLQAFLKIGYEKDLHFNGGMHSEHRRKGSKSER